MKSTIIAASFMASMALATPLQKRSWVTVSDVVTKTETVTGGAPTAASSSESWGSWQGGWEHSWSEESSAATTEAPATTATTTAASVTPTFVPSTTPAAVSDAWSSAASVASAAPSSASTPAASSGSVSSYAQAILDQHNNHRANHSVPALTWDNNMASIAQQIAASCVYAHNTQAGGGGYGQNIGAGAAPDAVAALITNEMYNGEIGWFPTPYGQSAPDMTNFEDWGHFSQIVWESTTAVGCYTQDCTSGLANTGSGVSPYFTVCNYSPAGNYAGQYGANIKAPSGQPSVVVPS